MTTPDPTEPPGRVRIVTFGTRGRLALLVGLVLVGAVLLVLGATLVVVLLGVVAALAMVALIGGAFGAIAGAIRTVLGRGRAQPELRAERPDPTMEVFPDPPARRTLTEGEGDDDRGP